MKNSTRKTTQIPPPVILKKPQATEGSQDILRPTQDDNSGNDRLSHALNFANELNESRLWKIRISYEKRWTHLKRARQSARIRYQKPWLRATGPKTAQGKAASAKNAMGGDAFDRAWFIPALQANERFLKAATLIATLQRNGRPVPDELRQYALTIGKDATSQLLNALLHCHSGGGGRA